jgi:hypothetical protein
MKLIAKENQKNNIMEGWMFVEGYNGLYMISNTGKLNRIGKVITRRNGTKVYIPGCEMKINVDKNGYCTVCLTINNKHRTLNFHRLVAKHFIRNVENKPCVNHKDGNKQNNHVNNLEWCTRSENSKHAFDTGLNWSYKGEEKKNSKLTNAQVLEMRKDYVPQKNSYPMLAIKYGVSVYTVRSIIRREAWAHI